MKYDFEYYPLSKAQSARGIVVVIDVLRAFTTAAYALAAGAASIFPVGTEKEAFRLKSELPNSLIMGEIHGRKPQGFDFGNSPDEISKADLSGKRLIQRTSAGTQGIVNARKSNILLAASFVVAGATANYIRQAKGGLVSFIITGEYLGRDGDEDLACAEYIAALIRDGEAEPGKYTARVMSSSVGQAFLSGQFNYLSEEDIQMSLDVNRFDFYLPVSQEQGRLVINNIQIE